MRRSGIFWGIVLLAGGALLLLNNLGYLNVDLWGLFWPAVLILAGLWVLFGVVGGGGGEVERASVPLGGAERAHVFVNHGVGPTRITGGTEPGVLMSGEFGGGVKVSARQEGAVKHLSMRMADRAFSFFPWTHDYDWRVNLSKDVPMTVRIGGGAGTLDFDMRDLRVTELEMEGSVGQATLTMPAHAGHTRAHVEGSVGQMTIRVPEGVAASIRADQGLGALHVDRERFPQAGERYFQSADYDTAANKIELKIEGGVGEVRVS
jgi:hypothetical protein